ncbi:hypothetical protein D3C85_702030 [compost metagenome]
MNRNSVDVTIRNNVVRQSNRDNRLYLVHCTVGFEGILAAPDICVLTIKGIHHVVIVNVYAVCYRRYVNAQSGRNDNFLSDVIIQMNFRLHLPRNGQRQNRVICINIRFLLRRHCRLDKHLVDIDVSRILAVGLLNLLVQGTYCSKLLKQVSDTDRLVFILDGQNFFYVRESLLLLIYQVEEIIQIE